MQNLLVLLGNLFVVSNNLFALYSNLLLLGFEQFMAKCYVVRVFQGGEFSEFLTSFLALYCVPIQFRHDTQRKELVVRWEI